MKNIYVEKMRQVLSAYFELRKMVDSDIEKNESEYTPLYAEKRNSLLREKKQKDYEDAVAEVRKIFNTVREYLARGNFPSGEEMIDEDIALLNTDIFYLTDAEIKMLTQKYRDSYNFTMLRLLHSWLKTNNRVYSDTFPLPQEQVKAYKKFAEAAIFTINGIYSGEKDHFIPLEIEHFGDEAMCADLYKIVGSGDKLIECGFKPVISDDALHVFDDISI